MGIDKFYTVQEVAEILRVKRPTILAWIGKGFLKAYSIGSRWIIKESDLKNFLNNLPEEVKGKKTGSKAEKNRKQVERVEEIISEDNKDFEEIIEMHKQQKSSEQSAISQNEKNEHQD